LRSVKWARLRLELGIGLCGCGVWDFRVVRGSGQSVADGVSIQGQGWYTLVWRATTYDLRWKR